MLTSHAQGDPLERDVADRHLSIPMLSLNLEVEAGEVGSHSSPCLTRVQRFTRAFQGIRPRLNLGFVLSCVQSRPQSPRVLVSIKNTDSDYLQFYAQSYCRSICVTDNHCCFTEWMEKVTPVLSSKLAILVPRASVSFGHVVGETKGSGSSHYRMSVNHGHPVTHA